MRIKVLIKFW